MHMRTNRSRNTGRPDRDTGQFSGHPSRSPSKSSRPQANTANTNGIANAKSSYERYMTLARTATSIGDAVDIENLYQHAEHYLRLMKKQTA